MIDRDRLFEVINDWDPIGLIMMSAPYNEYAPEVDAILEELDESMSLEEIAQLVDDTFHYYFNNNNPKASAYEREWEHVYEVAKKIKEAM